MGPFSHDALPAPITAESSPGTDGFGFVEHAHPEPERLPRLFRAWRQGERGTGNDLRPDAWQAGELP